MNRMHWITVGGMAGGLIVVLVLGWQFLLKPLGTLYDAKVAEKEQLEQQLATTKQRAAQFEKFKAEAENVHRDLDFYSRRLDGDLPSSELYTLVDGLGHSLNFTTWSFEAQKRAKTKIPNLNLDEVEVKTKFSADYERVGKLINLCVSQVRIIVPDGVLLTRVKDLKGGYLDTLNAELTFKVLVSPPEGGS